jgi:hypothetical protein
MPFKRFGLNACLWSQPLSPAALAHHMVFVPGKPGSANNASILADTTAPKRALYLSLQPALAQPHQA